MSGVLLSRADSDAERYRYVRPAEMRRLRRWNLVESSRETLFVETPDGWRLALSCYSHPQRVDRSLPPLLFCHGLGSNRLTFDVDRRHSLARWLADQGHDVYAVDLRGHGLSEKPGVGASHKHWGWGFNDYCETDLPTIIDAVLELSGAATLNYIGHSMGGILLYCHAAITEDPRISRGITLGSSLDYSNTPSVFHLISGLAPLTRLLPFVPTHWPAVSSSYLCAWGSKFIDPVLVNPANVSLPVYRKMAANVMHPTSSPVLRELAGAITGKGMRDSRGRDYRKLLADTGYRFPILAISGMADRQCSPLAAARFGTHWKTFSALNGYCADYGHDDLIMGPRAPEETWPAINGWLLD